MRPDYSGLRTFLEKRGSKTVAERLLAMNKIATLKRPTSTVQDLLRQLRKPSPVPDSVQEAQRRHSQQVFARVKADIAKRRAVRKQRSASDMATAQNRSDVLFGRGQASTTMPFDLGDMQKASSVEYRGKTFPGYNQPVRSDRPEKKMMVLAKDGDRVKLIHFGQKGYKHNYSDEAKANYLRRSAGIRGKGGKLTANDKMSANYWARRELWPKGKADGSNASAKK